MNKKYNVLVNGDVYNKDMLTLGQAQNMVDDLAQEEHEEVIIVEIDDKKHLFGRVYFKPPCFIGFKLYSRVGVIVGNIVLSLLTVGVITLIISRLV